MTQISPKIRKAELADAADLAILTDMAGGGLPAWLWQGAVNMGKAGHAFDWGRAQMLGDAPFGHRSAIVCEMDGVIAGGVVSYLLPESLPDDAFKMPIPELDAMGNMMAASRGTWFIDAIAIYDGFRKRGLGSFMLGHVEHLAREAGVGDIRLIARTSNEAALNLYEDNGYREVSREFLVPWNLNSQKAADEEYWILMSRKLVSE